VKGDIKVMENTKLKGVKMYYFDELCKYVLSILQVLPPWMWVGIIIFAFVIHIKIKF
jgi:hypothetical protein